jgi:hypothetical protein
MKQINFFRTSSTIFVFVVSSFPASLEVNEITNNFIDKIESNKNVFNTNLNLPANIDSGEAEGCPVLYEVINSGKRDEELLGRLRNHVANPDNLNYNLQDGMTCYEDIELQRSPLVLSDSQDLERLEKKAKETVETLLGTELYSHFIFANEETDYLLEKEKATPCILRKSYRFTKKLNGCHIIDNTAYIKVSFSGNQQLCRFEMANPEIKHLKPVERQVKFSITKKRLVNYVNKKNTEIKNGVNGIETVSIKSINVKKGIKTYISKICGDKLLLIPYISFYAEHKTESGESFKRWIHFCLDADYEKDVDKEMIFNNAPQ